MSAPSGIGAGRIRLSGVVRGRRLPPGSYRLIVRARGAGGTSRARTLSLRVV